MNERISFTESNGDPEELNKGLKVDSSKSMFKSTKLEESSSESFEEEIKEYENKERVLANRTLESSMKFRDVLNDKTLLENKPQKDKYYEKEIMRELCQVALEMNNDENKPEGAGSVGLHGLILNMLLLQRNTINELHYKIFKLTKKVEELKDVK